MHLLIFAIFALYALGATNFALYAATLFVYFFPWGALKQARVFRSRAESAVSTQVETSPESSR